MGDLLNSGKAFEEPSQRETIQEMIEKPLSRSIGRLFFLMLVFLSILFFFLGYMHQQETPVLTLNTFYGALENMEDALHLYTINSTEQQYALLEEAIAEAKTQFEKVCQMKISPVFSRNLRDCSHMLAHYYRNIERIHVMAQSRHPLVLEAYQENVTISTIFSHNFRRLYAMILEKGETTFRHIRFFMRTFFVILWIFLLGEYLALRHDIRDLARSLSAPIVSFTEDIRQVAQQGIMDWKPPTTGQEVPEELNILETVFRAMLQVIGAQQRESEKRAQAERALQDKTLENLRISRELERLQMESLQFQMNPHFLFNTLSLISQSAYMHEDPETAALLQATAHLLRYSLDYSNKSVTLFQEVESAERYVSIQEVRFGNRIQFIFDLDESFHHVLVPNLILQPLIENAITHGLRNTIQGGIVTLKTSRSGDYGILSVTDNGKGMEDWERELVKKLLASPQMPEERSQHIGLRNVSQRLRFFFGTRASLVVENSPQGGVQARIMIPIDMDKGGEEIDSSTDR